MSKIKAILMLFQKGSVVVDPAKWKARQITVTLLASVVWAGLRIGGIDDQVGSETVDAIAGGVIAGVNLVLTLTTSDKVGLPSKR